MRPDPCAVLFDLDDTLYSRQRFVLSGFAAVSRALHRTRGIDPRAAFAVLCRAHRTARGRELQALASACGLAASMVPGLVDVIREHAPRLRLPRASARVLETLRDGWRVGIVTNGPPDIQARKVEALGLARLVDTVVFAHATGSGAGKPDPAPFLEAARRLGVAPARTVFVGDDPVADIAGARGVGMYAVRLLGRGAHTWEAAGAADAVVQSIEEVPSVAIGLIDGRRAYVV